MTNHTPIDKGKSAKTIRQLMGVAWPEQRSTCSLPYSSKVAKCTNRPFTP